jgi:Acetyltransferase (GNAT) domain
MQPMVPEILDAANSEDAERWATLVAGSPAADVYYLPAYALASSQIEDSDPLAIVAGPEHCRFLAPLLLRRLSAVVDGTRIRWTDLCSPYGYGGLLPLSAGPPTARDLHCFLKELQDWARLRNAVCCALRLHPLMRQDEWFTEEQEGLFKMRLRGPTTAIDLTKWDNACNRPAGMRKDRRPDLNRASRVLRVTWATGSDSDISSSMERFIALYYETMEFRHAGSFYKFPFAYFSHLASLGSSFRIAFAWLDDKLAAASIFLAGSDYTHYHLAAANEIGMKYGAATLLIIEGARWARAQHCKLLHLGGGLSPGDTLEAFKRSFGSQLYRYAYVVSTGNPELFAQICRIPDAPWPYRVENE